MWCCCFLCQWIIPITHALHVAPGETSHSQIMSGVQCFFSSNRETRFTFIVPTSWINPLKLINICKITFFSSPSPWNISCEDVKWPWTQLYFFASSGVWGCVNISIQPPLLCPCSWSWSLPATFDVKKSTTFETNRLQMRRKNIL